ncbi:hypothetical protein ACFVH0_35915 [Streptomyces sp. NPDC127117]|uniref:hypothetical protein n=1 Tax=Streptomyces sp. NPDC127117 TaxID=3345368 RepID=UPI003627DF3B
MTRPPVPYVVMWDSEQGVPERELTVDMKHQPRLAYRGDPRPSDRDGSGVLWARVSSSPGIGRPLYDCMHPSRQYETMFGLRCQVCRGPASKTPAGWLFLDWRKPGDPPTWPEGSRTIQPPLCELHARQAVAQCPHLGRGDHVALRVRSPRLWGAAGALYTLTAQGWHVHPGDAWLHKRDSQQRGLLASKLIRELVGVTAVDLGP